MACAICVTCFVFLLLTNLGWFFAAEVAWHDSAMTFAIAHSMRGTRQDWHFRVLNA
jgi:hypothetical protein